MHLCIVFILLLMCVPTSILQAAMRPNVILMMADDMGMGDTSAYQDITGNSDEVQVATPGMERLARMGVRFTDAHTPSSRCTSTRYGLLTGRSPWRTELKHFVLFGSQGDPLIERDRPTLGTLFQSQGYGTALVGKWHVGLRYRNSQGQPAGGWEDADLTQPLFDGPLDHGFAAAWFTSRSHGTSGRDMTGWKGKQDQRRNALTIPGLNGPGHVHGRDIIGATGPQKVVGTGPKAYVLRDLGSRHSDHAIAYLNSHLAGGDNSDKPFFLYYPANSNHGPHTPCEAINGVNVKGASHTKAGNDGTLRMDFIYENDVALSRMLDWLCEHDDPRHPGKKMVDTTIVIFTSDNGAEIKDKAATGPFRSHKGSCYEGGHRVPLIVAWGAGGIGNGNPETPGMTNHSLTSLTDLYATFAELLGVAAPDYAAGEKGAEDSISQLAAWKGAEVPRTVPLFVNDHAESKVYPNKDPAMLAMRLDNPRVEEQEVSGQWKVFFTPALLREGIARPVELYDLQADPMEAKNLIESSKHQSLLQHLSHVAERYRGAGGLNLEPLGHTGSVHFDCKSVVTESEKPLELKHQGVTLSINSDSVGALVVTKEGLGVSGHQCDNVDSGEALLLRFDRDVIIESLAIWSQTKDCGGFYTIGDGASRSIYCVNADPQVSRDQQAKLQDIGVLQAGQVLRLDSSPHQQADLPGEWTLQAVTVRPCKW